MKKYSSPITEENFEDASRIILKKCRKYIGRSRAYNIVVPLSTVLFMFLSLIFTYGAIYSIRDAEDQVVFDTLKPITGIWQFFADTLIQEGAAWYINIAVFAAALLLIPMIISLIVSIIFTITAKEPTMSVEATSAKGKARALYETVSGVKKGIDVDEGLLSLWCGGVYIAIVLAFTIYSVVLTFDFSQPEELISLIIGAGVVFTVAYFAYSYLFMLSYFMNTCACTPESIYKYKSDAYDYLCSVDPEEAKLNEEKKKEEEAKKQAASSNYTTSSYAGMAYYEEKKAEAMRNIDKYVYGYSYPDYKMTGIHLDDKEALRQYLNSNAPDSVKAEAIKKYNDYHLDNFNG